MNGKEATRKLEAEGWQLVRVRGSYHLMEKGDKVVPIPIHGSKDLGKGLIARISRQTGVKL